MFLQKSYKPSITLVFLATIIVASLFFCFSENPFDLFPSTPGRLFSFNLEAKEWPRILNNRTSSNPPTLASVLENAATMNRTVILTTVNEAWVAPHSILDLFLESFRIGEETRNLLNHLVIIALDEKAFNRCLSVHDHCFSLTTEGVDFSQEKNFMTPDYLKMMWRRIDFLRTILEMGYNFVFTDADIMWFRRPFPYFSDGDADIEIACDYFLGNYSDMKNRANGGFNYVRSNPRTVRFYKYWYRARELYPGKHDQDVFEVIKCDREVVEMGVRFRFLDTANFGGFCEPSRDMKTVCTMHANCCVGLENKIHDLRAILEDWRNYTALPQEEKRVLRASIWSAPTKCTVR